MRIPTVELRQSGKGIGRARGRPKYVVETRKRKPKLKIPGESEAVRKLKASEARAIKARARREAAEPPARLHQVGVCPFGARGRGAPPRAAGARQVRAERFPAPRRRCACRAAAPPRRDRQQRAAVESGAEPGETRRPREIRTRACGTLAGTTAGSRTNQEEAAAAVGLITSAPYALRPRRSRGR